jgi:hypothetical protein
VTRILLTDLDYQVIEAGDPNEIKRHFNEVRNELFDTQTELNELETTVKHAIQSIPDPIERACALKEAVKE